MRPSINCPKCGHSMRLGTESSVVCRECLFRCHIEYANGWNAALSAESTKSSQMNKEGLSNSLQQLKAKIALLIPSVEDLAGVYASRERVIAITKELGQLSAVCENVGCN